MSWRGFGFVHHSRTLFCRAVPSPNLTIRNFFIAAQVSVTATPNEATHSIFVGRDLIGGVQVAGGVASAPLVLREGDSSLVIRVVDATGFVSVYTFNTIKPLGLRAETLRVQCESRCDMVDAGGATPQLLWFEPAFDPERVTTRASPQVVEVLVASMQQVRFDISATFLGSTVRERLFVGAPTASWPSGTPSTTVFDLLPGNNDFEFVVTSPVDSGGQTISLFVRLVALSMPTLLGITSSDAMLLPPFDATTTAYTVAVAAELTSFSLALRITASTDTATLERGGVSLCGGNCVSGTVYTIPLSAATVAQPLTVTVTDRFTNDQSIYTLSTTSAALPTLSSVAFTSRTGGALTFLPAFSAAIVQVRLCRYRFSPSKELEHSGIRGAVGSGYRFTVQALLLILTFYC
jgi:hypothetical protein